MSEISVASCFIMNPRHEALMLYRCDYKQWQLPGGRVEDGELAITAATREVHEKLGVAPTAIHKLGMFVVEQGGVSYRNALFQVTDFDGEVTNMQPGVYAGPKAQDLYKRNIGRMSTSPIVERAVKELIAGRILLAPQYPVQ